MAWLIGPVHAIMVRTPNAVNMMRRFTAQKTIRIIVAMAKYGNARQRIDGMVRYSGLNLPPYADMIVRRNTIIEIILITRRNTGFKSGIEIISNCVNIQRGLSMIVFH